MCIPLYSIYLNIIVFLVYIELFTMFCKLLPLIDLIDSDKQIVDWQRFLILLHVKCYADDYGVIKGIFFYDNLCLFLSLFIYWNIFVFSEPPRCWEGCSFTTTRERYSYPECTVMTLGEMRWTLSEWTWSMLGSKSALQSLILLALVSSILR